MKREYDGSEIVRLSDAEHVRQRPRMYLGDIDFAQSGNCLARESLCLAIDQVARQTCRTLTVQHHRDGRLVHLHDGEPLGVDPQTRHHGKSECELVAEALWMCQLRAKSEWVSADVCKVSLPTVNFLSAFFRLDSFHPSGHYSVKYARGVSETGLQRLGDCSKSGVRIEFRLDHTILGKTSFDLDSLREWFEGLPLPHSHVDVTWARVE